jgi:hypothetical protein
MPTKVGTETESKRKRRNSTGHAIRPPPPLPSSSSSGMRNLDGWKGRQPPDRLRILYIKKDK